MKIKDYKCKCGHSDFFFADKGNQKGIYCSYCGRWFKWADMDERNLAMKQEPVLDKIKGYVEHIRNTGLGKNKSLEFIENFINGLMAESENKE